MRKLILALVASLTTLVCTAQEVDFWQKNYPQLRDPRGDSLPKVRTRAKIENIEALATAGFGAAEIGVDFRAPPAAARVALRAMLEAGHRFGVSMDIAPGGSQPYQSPGMGLADSMQQLVTDSIRVEGPKKFEWAPVQPQGLAGQARLVAVSAARVVSESGTPILLEVGSAVDISAKLDRSGKLQWQTPPGIWRVFTYWQRATGQAMLGKPFEPPSAWSARDPSQTTPAALTADIFSGKGIAAALQYLGDNYLKGSEELLRGAELAHDSLEVQAEMFWTADMPEQFKRRRGYSIIPYLPALNTPRESSFDPLDPSWGGPFPARAFDFEGEAGERLRYDYRQTLTDLYCERYLAAIERWAHGKGLRTRSQVAYNYLALDALRSGRAVDIPENESFDHGWNRPFDSTLPAYGTDRWRHAMDAYRLTGSALHLSGRSRATLEFGDDFAIYRKQPADYAQQLSEALAVGVTQGLLTGFAGTDHAWPEPQGLAHIGLGDEWTLAWPQWRDWRNLNRYFARVTQLLESGKPRVDVAIYHDRGLAGIHEPQPLYADASLESAGYTYDFIDPAALSTPDAGAVAGRLYGNGAAYRAVILDQQVAMPVSAAEAVMRLAQRGLRVVIVGAAPAHSPGFADAAHADAKVGKIMSRLAKAANVAVVRTRAEVAGALQRLGVAPAASFGEGSPLLSVHRDNGNASLYWIFNPTDKAISARGSFAVRGAPYEIDLWSGVPDRVPEWREEDERMLIPLLVMPHQSVALLMRRDEVLPRHVTGSTAAHILQQRDTVLVIPRPGSDSRLDFSDGATSSVVGASFPAVLTPNRWHLSVQESGPDGVKQHEMELSTLKDWREFPELKDAVGSASYTTTLELPASWFGEDRGLILAVGEVAGAMQLTVNDHLVTEQTLGNGHWLVDDWLKPGTNTVTVRVDTTLLNRFVALRASGDPRYQTGPTPLASAPSGLLGPVHLVSAARLPMASPGTR
jgi:alpha-L-rhamnosidase